MTGNVEQGDLDKISRGDPFDCKTWQSKFYDRQPLMITLTSSKPSDNSGLVSFRLGSQDAEKENPVFTGRWVPLGKPIMVSGVLILRGGLYCGAPSPEHQSDNIRIGPCVINHDLKIAEHDTLPPGKLSQINYTLMGPDARSHYLKWLSKPFKKIKPFTLEDDFAALYFQGLERRVIVDAASKQAVTESEYDNLHKALLELAGCSHHGFAYKVYKLIQWMKLKRGTRVSLNEVEVYGLADVVSVSLSKSANLGRPISSGVARAWLRFTSFNTELMKGSAGRHAEKLFALLYHRAYGEGLILQPCEKKLHISYVPMNPLLKAITLNTSQMCDPLQDAEAQKKIEEIGRQCRHALKDYMVHAEKNGSTQDDLVSLLLLPVELLETVDDLPLGNFTQWVEDVLVARQGRVKFKEIMHRLDMSPNEPITKHTQGAIDKLLRITRYSLAPCSSYHQIDVGYDTKVVIYPVESSANQELSSAFYQMILTIRTCFDIGGKSVELISKLNDLIDEEDLLCSDEKKALNAYLFWSASEEPDAKGIFKNISKIESVHSVLSNVVRIVGSTSVLSKAHIVKLTRLAKKLGFDEARVYPLLNIAHADVQVKKTPGVNVKAGDSPAPFSLDLEALERHEQDTQKVQALLGSIFNDAEDKSVDLTPAKTRVDQNQASIAGVLGHSGQKAFILSQEALLRSEQDTRKAQDLLADLFDSQADSTSLESVNQKPLEEKSQAEIAPVALHCEDGSMRFNGLTENHRELLETLVTKETWTLQEVSSLCQTRGLMPSGALEIINDWSFDTVDEAVLDIADEIHVFMDVVDTLTTHFTEKE